MVTPSVTSNQRLVDSVEGQADERILLGHVTGIYGLKGWIKVHSDTSPRENIVSYKQWWLEQGGNWRQVGISGGRPQGKTIVAQVNGITTPEQASQLIGAKIAVGRSTLPEATEGEYYWTDLIGMQVVTADGVVIGPVDRLFETGANDVAVVTDLREQAGNAVSDDGEPVQAQDVLNVPGDDAVSSKATGGKVKREVLVPWLVPDVITEVDLDKRVIVVDWDPDF